MHVLKMFAFLLLPLAVLAGANGAHEIVRTELSERIAHTHKIIRCDSWQGGRRTVFDFDGHEAWVVEPPADVPVAKGRPWTWTMQWKEAFVPRTGVPQLLKRGFHHVALEMFESRADEALMPTDGWTSDPRMPINLAKPLADAGIPVLLAYGGADNILDPKLNSELFIPRFKDAGGKITVIYREAWGHHPHGFEIDDPTIPDFFCGNGLVSCTSERW